MIMGSLMKHIISEIKEEKERRIREREGKSLRKDEEMVVETP